MSLQILGPLRVLRGTQEVALGSASLARLCSRLLVAGGRPLSADRLHADVWGDRGVGASTLRVALMRLRGHLGDSDRSIVVRAGSGWTLDTRHVSLDLTDFEAALSQARAADPPEALTLLHGALALWRGRPFGGVGDDAEWLEAEVQRSEERREAALDERGDALVAVWPVDAAVPVLVHAAAEAPLRERRTATLMVALHRAGRSSDAVEAFRRHAAALQRELRVAPSQALRDLEVRIREQDPSLRPAPELRRHAEADPSVQARRAARELAARGLFDAASRQAERAYTLAISESGRAEALAASGEIDLRSGANERGAIRLAEAATAARRLGDGPLLARVALIRFGREAVDGIELADELTASIFEAFASLGERRPERVDLLLLGIFTMMFRARRTEASILLDEADALARSFASPIPAAVAAAARALLALIDESDFDEAQPLAAQAVALAAACGDPRAELAARWLECRILAEGGALDALAERLDAFERAGRQTLLPVAATSTSMVRTLVALAKGDLASATGHIDETIALGPLLGVRAPVQFASAQRVLSMLEQGRAAEVLAVVGHNVPSAWTDLAISAIAAARAGDHALAAACLADLDRHLEPGPLYPLRGVVAALAAEAGSLIGRTDLGLAERVLARRSGCWAILASHALTIGPIDRYLAMCRAAAGDHERAVALATAALASTQGSRTTLWFWRARLDLAGHLLQRGRSGDRSAAAELCREVAAAALPADWVALGLELQDLQRKLI